MLDHETQSESLKEQVATSDTGDDAAASADSKSDTGESSSALMTEDTGLSGYMSYTSSDSASVRSSGAEQSLSERAGDDGSRNSGREWMAYASIVGGALSVYSSPMVFSGVLLGVSAIVIGILGTFGKKRTLSVIGILAGLAGVILSVLLASLYVQLFNIVYSYLAGGFGFRLFGW